MHLAYVDESGDSGSIAGGGSKTYTLGCVLVRASQWPEAFNALISYRRFLRDTFRIPVRAELKANFLLRNGGSLRAMPLSEGARRAIYRGHMRMLSKLQLSAFAIVINKAKLANGLDPHFYAWNFLLQRLERLSSLNKDQVLVVHDEGESVKIKRIARRSRRAGSAGSAFGTGALKRPFVGLLDDVVPRNSAESYFLQLADMSAYAAYRRIFPPSSKKVQIVSAETWDEIGDARFKPANQNAGGVSPGIVFWPK